MSAYEINKPIAVPDRVTKVMKLLTHAASTGAECPTNEVIRQRIGAQSASGAANAIKLLESMGLISVERTRSARCVTILATGKSTTPINRRIAA